MEISINELGEKLKGSGALLGLDLGTKTIGLAVSDVNWQIASPLKTIISRKFTQDVEELKEIICARDIKGLVLGLPVNMDGSEGRRAQSARSFARNLKGLLPLPLVFWDERLSTFEAEEQMIAADLSRRKRMKKIDAAAAAIILQGALDQLCKIKSDLPAIGEMFTKAR